MLEAAVAVGQRQVLRGEQRLASPRVEDARQSSTAATSDSCAPALAHTAPPTVPGIARPNSSPDRPPRCVSVAARAIGTPASATSARRRRATPRRGSGSRARARRHRRSRRRSPARGRGAGSARPRETDKGAELECVVRRGEEVGRPAHPHRREPGERLVARRLDADPALDVGAGREGSKAAVSAVMPPFPATGVRCFGVRQGRRSATARTRRATASAALGRPNSRAAVDIARCAAGRRGSWRPRAARRRRMPRPRSPARPPRRPAPGHSPVGGLQRGGTAQTVAPSAVASASVELPARPRSGPPPRAPRPIRARGRAPAGSARAGLDRQAPRSRPASASA